MIEHQCLSCETIAYTSATGGSSHGCPSCGAPLDEALVADQPQPEVPMNSVQAVRSAEGLREQAIEKR